MVTRKRAHLAALALLIAILAPAMSQANAIVELSFCQQAPDSRGCQTPVEATMVRGEALFVHLAVIRPADQTYQKLSKTLLLYDNDGQRVFSSDPLLELGGEGLVAQGAIRINSEAMLPGEYRLVLRVHDGEGKLVTLAERALKVSSSDEEH
jgi:hypothetical protein